MPNRVLIVDDLAMWREVVCMVLQSGGLETRCAASGQEAIQILRREHIDLMLLDLSMPGMDGPALLQAIRDDGHISPPPVIVLTAGAEPMALSRLGRFRVRRCLIKSSIEPEELYGVVLNTIQEVKRAADDAA